MKYKIFASLILTFLLFFSCSYAFAKPECNEGKGEVCLTDPLGLDGASSGPQQLIGRIIKGVLGLVGSLALAMFVYGGFTWMLAAGNASNVDKGKQILVWATIGLVVIFSSYALVQFVFKDVLSVVK